MALKRSPCLGAGAFGLTLAVVALTAAISLPALAQDRVTFASLDTDLAGGRATTIVAWLYRPQGNGPFPAVVGMHGCGGLLVHFRRLHAPVIETTFDDWARRLQAAGYVVLLPDSYGPRGITEICSKKDREAVSRARPRDAYAALGWLQAQPYVAPERIALIGWSHGGGTVMRSVEASSEARPSVLPHGGFRAAVAFYPGCPNVRTRKGRAWRAGLPLLVLIGAADDWASPAACPGFADAAAKRGEDVTLHMYPGAYHAFDSPKPGVRVRTGLATAPGGTAHVGQNPGARADALVRVPAFLRLHLGG